MPKRRCSTCGAINGIGNEATWLRRIEGENHLLPEVVRRAAKRWHG